jgi:preprotein translocase subunit SecD
MSNLRFRVTVVVAAVLLSVWVLLPTFLGKDVQARLEAAAARASDPELAAPATPDPWFIAWLPNKVLTRGLDLQGGIDLTLDVDTDGLTANYRVPALAAGASTVIAVPVDKTTLATRGALTYKTTLSAPIGINDQDPTNNIKTSRLTAPKP